MATDAYVGVLDAAKKIVDIYVGVDGQAKRVVKAYVGDSNGLAKLWWDGNAPSGFIIFENGVFNHVPEGFVLSVYSDSNIDVSDLSDDYLTELALWVHDVSITNNWNVIGLDIDSRYYDYDNQYVMNYIYIPINRIENPERLRVNGRGHFLMTVGCIDPQDGMIEQISNRIVCDNESQAYDLDIDLNYVDYVIFKTEEPPVVSGDTLIDYDGEVQYFNLPVHVQEDQLSFTEYNATRDYYEDWEFNVIEGHAYGLMIQNEDQGTAYHVCFYSDQPFKVRYFDPSGFRYITVLSAGPYGTIDAPFYCRYIYGSSGNGTTNVPVGFTRYGNSNVSALTISESDTSIVWELGKIVVKGNVVSEDDSSLIKIDDNLSLQQISRIAIFGGTENPVIPEEDDEIISDENIIGYWRQPIQFVTAGNTLEYSAESSNGAYWYTDSLVVPENCVGCIMQYSNGQYGWRIFSKSAFRIPNIHTIDYNGEHETDEHGGSGDPNLTRNTVATLQYKYSSYGQTIFTYNSGSITNTNVIPADQVLQINNMNDAYWELAYIAEMRGLL